MSWNLEPSLVSVSSSVSFIFGITQGHPRTSKLPIAHGNRKAVGGQAALLIRSILQAATVSFENNRRRRENMNPKNVKVFVYEG